MNTDVSIITVNYNGLRDTCALIDTIPFDEYALEVIVVDNGSMQNEADVISKKYPRVRAIRSEQNLGFAGGNNLGIQAAKGKYLFFINNDTIFKKDGNLQALINRLESAPTIGMVCPKIRFAWDSRPIQFAGYTPLSYATMRNRAIGYMEADQGQYNASHPTPYGHGAAMMVKREVIENVGLMPECYFLYYEEIDWSMMIRRAGYDIWYEAGSCIYHKESQTTGQFSPLKIYYITHNRLLFVQRNLHGLEKWLSYAYHIIIVSTKDALKYTLKGRFDLVKAVWRGVYNFMRK